MQSDSVLGIALHVLALVLTLVIMVGGYREVTRAENELRAKRSSGSL